MRLIEARKRRGWSQQEVAARLGTIQHNVSRWELGLTTPTHYFRRQLSKLFGQSMEELELLVSDLPAEGGGTHGSEGPVVTVTVDVPRQMAPQPSEQAPLQVWHVPLRRNPFFTGREAMLWRLQEVLEPPCEAIARAPSVALTGLPGIGKTQIALEYAYRAALHYSAVLWVSAETSETLLTSFVSIAAVLTLPERQEPDQRKLVQAVMHWLNNHDGWLLIYDNVEDLGLLTSYLPTTRTGSILITTRLHALGGIAEPLFIDPMTPEEGLDFLLRRTRLLGPGRSLAQLSPAEVQAARAIVDAMDGLPLALDQAGAYIEETGCHFTDYLAGYRERRALLLARRGEADSGHPAPVTTTFALALETVTHTSPAAADLLRLCAFLHPGAIPEELFTEGASALGPELQAVGSDAFTLNTALSILRRYSLIERHSETKTIHMHRLVQQVVRDKMDEQARRGFAERLVQALNRAFPESQEPEAWPRCQRYLPHVLACQDLIAEFPVPWEAASGLLSRAGIYLTQRRQHEQAESLLVQAYQIRLECAGPDHPESAASLHQGKHAQAAQFLQQALSLREQHFPADHPAVLESALCLATTYQEQGHYREAANLFRRLLAVSEQAYGPLHLKVAEVLHRMAAVLRQLGSYDEALSCLLRALSIFEQTRGTLCEDVAFCHEQLGLLLRDCNQDEAALQHFQRSLCIREDLYGPDEVRTARSLYVLGSHYRKVGRYDEAFPLLTRALSIRQRVLGPTHVMTAVSLEGLGLYHLDQGEWSEAQSLLQQSLSLLEQELGISHPEVGKATFYLARVYAAQGHYAQAEPLYQRALATLEQALGEDHPALVTYWQGYAELLRQTHHPRQAAVYESRVRKILGTHAGRFSSRTTGRSEKNADGSPSFAAFLAECCEMDAQAQSRSADLWRAYKRWRAAQKTAQPLSRRAFAQQLALHGCQAVRTKNSRLWLGIALAPGWRDQQGDANA